MPEPRLLKATSAAGSGARVEIRANSTPEACLGGRKAQPGFVGRTVGARHEKPLGWRQKNEAEAHLAVFDQGDIDRKLRFAANKEPRPVERIDEEKLARVFAGSPRRDPFLGNDRNIRRNGGKRGEQHGLGLMIRDRDGRSVGLLLEFHAFREMRHLEAAGLAHCRKQRIDQGVVIFGVDRQHGESECSGSNRYSANAVARGQCLFCAAAWTVARKNSGLP